MKQEKKRFGFLQAILLIGCVPLLTAIMILSVYSALTLQRELRESVYDRLYSCATAVQKYFEWDIREDILEKDDVSYEFIDSMKDQNIELTLFLDDTRYMTSIMNDRGVRNEGTTSDPMIWEKVKNGEAYFEKGINISGFKYYVCYLPVYNADDEVIGMAFAGEKQQKVIDAISVTVKQLAGTSVILTVIFMVMLIFFSFLIRKPLRNVTDSITKIANGDITSKIVINSKIKETSVLINAAKVLQNELSTVVTSIDKEVMDLHKDTDLLRAEADSCDSGAGQISTAMEELATTATTLADNVQDVNSKAIQMGDNIEVIFNDVESLNNHTSAMQEAEANTSTAIEDTLSCTSDAYNNIKLVNTQMEETNEAIKNISKAVDLIADITTQTNLLSLNASIEAARAGQAGRGFAVVAEEIKKLAEQSAQGADSIKQITEDIVKKSAISVEMLEKVTESMDKEVSSLNSAKDDFEILSAKVNDSIEAVKHISKKTEELDSLKNSILENINDLSAISEENAASNEEVSASVTDISQRITSMNRSVTDVNDATNRIAELMKYFK